MEQSFYYYLFSLIMFIVVLGGISLYLNFRSKRRDLERKHHLLLKQKSGAQLRHLAAGVSHEINNALTIIQGKTEQLLRKYKDPDLEKSLMTIRKSSERIESSVKGLRQFIYQDHETHDEFISVQTLVDDVLRLFGQRLKNHGIEIKLKGLEDKLIRANRLQMEQVILNLLNHSLEVLDTLPQKWIEISAFEGEDTINIYFKDSRAVPPYDESKEDSEPIFTHHKDEIDAGLFQTKDILEKHHGALVKINNGLYNTTLIELPRPKIQYHH